MVPPEVFVGTAGRGEDLRLWTYGALGRLPLIGFRGKVVALAAIAVGFPFVGWLAPGEGLTRAATLAGAFCGATAVLVLLSLLLRPLGLLGRALEACARLRDGRDLERRDMRRFGAVLGTVVFIVLVLTVLLFGFARRRVYYAGGER